MITIRLPHDHTHAGKKHLKGEEFSFEDLDQYDWFVAATAGMRGEDIAVLERTEGSAQWTDRVIADHQARQVEAGEAEEGGDDGEAGE